MERALNLLYSGYNRLELGLYSESSTLRKSMKIFFLKEVKILF